MQTFDNVHKRPFEHDVVVTVSGKAGETKTVSARADEKRLLVFRGQTLKAADTVGGEGSILRGISIMGKPQMRWPRVTRDINWLFNRGFAIDVLHPRSEVSFTVEFKRDCEFTGMICGRAVEVPNDGVYAIEPPAVACERAVPDELCKGHYWDLRQNASMRCEHCWHKFSDHKWPWQEREIPVEVEAIEPGEDCDILFEVDDNDRRVIPHTARIERSVFASDKWDKFVTPGFSSKWRAQFFNQPKSFDYYIGNISCEFAESYILRVSNTDHERRAFKGTVLVLESTEV